MKNLLDILLNFFFPKYCLGCKIGGIFLCNKCINITIRASKTPAPNTYSIFSYKEKIIKDALWKLKYHGNKSIAKEFAKHIHEQLLEEVSEMEMFNNFKNPILIPIPLSKKRFRERGFNQSEAIASELHLLNRDAFDISTKCLVKTKDTPSQMSIKNRTARLANLNGCFSVKNNSDISDRNIILIDDITTTGATIAEAQKTLLSAGAKQTIAFTIAH